MTEQQKRVVVELCQRRKKRVLAKKNADAQTHDQSQPGHQEDLFKSDT
ncbi:hypothetical protein N474_05770 [Pseudoalteromonas luteoviolacea CPMOR-2]|uniref:Uncharacterized protein n=2 Tax=Pseudoalteromonas luteoviolacea TaxID=43657 RepID=A0A166YJS4_9GAMM|nr:hypothetical protein N475_10260 [Pseudoalteromonas luteoviolacea DSM 6061]KZN59900.1 hypothetical protein N474_05770 [Pseudoalteromonas luteoviolacea CPMOR-2]MBE0385101.1 hypothetical protein [Pseudoalteromonas luteoviolacea DSM 6061]